METNPDESPNLVPIVTEETLPESPTQPEALAITDINQRKPIITEDRFMEGIKSGFLESEIAHLTEDQQDRLAMAVANKAREQWNTARQSEISSNKAIIANEVQSAMADEIFTATMAYLHTIPSGVRDKVIIKFQSLPAPKRLITL